MKILKLKSARLILILIIYPLYTLLAQAKPTEQSKNTSLHYNNNKGLFDGKLFSYQLNVGLNYTQLTNYYENYAYESIGNYISNARAAHTFQSDAFIFFKNKLGLGIGYEYYSKSLKSGLVDLGTNTFPVYANFKHDIRFHNFTSTFMIKTPLLKNKLWANVFGGIDFTNYINPYNINLVSYELSGQKMGFHLGLANEFALNSTFNFGVKLKYHQLTLDKVSLIEGTNEIEQKLSGDDKINLNRISIGIYVGLK